MIVQYGTAGWSYKDWVGTVYPDKIPSGFNHLHFIAEKFDFVEVNTTFYRTPDIKLTEGWIRKTSDLEYFRFWIKLNRIFTHTRVYSKSDVEAFIHSISPLSSEKKLGGVLIQFPYSFKLTGSNLKYLIELTDNFAPLIIAVEFRHKNWVNDEVVHLFREKGIIWVNIDQPVISQSLPITSIITNTEYSYFRLHGRNYKSWFSNEGRDARYNYSYSEKELIDISLNIKNAGLKAKKILVSGNNHYKGAAVNNLILLKKILKSIKESG